MGLFDHLYHLDWTAKYPLEYYYKDGRHVIFDKYEIDMFGGIYNKKTGQRMSYRKSGEYDMTTVCDNTGNQYGILIARASVSTFHEKPPTIYHSAEHINCENKDNNIVCELTWMNSSGQQRNRNMPEDLLIAYIIVRDDIEMTAKEWSLYLSDDRNHMGRRYTKYMISQYAQQKKHGFSYKVYEDLPGETWYKIMNSENSKGRWEISDQNRIARVTKFARNVIDVTRFGFNQKHPIICINGKNRGLHAVAFEAYYPEEFAAKLSGEMILHKLDNKLDFRPHSLYIGNASNNLKDAHNNGCYANTKRARQSCISYINGIFEKQHESPDDAEKYLKANGFPNADHSNISTALRSKKTLTRYGRTWSLSSSD
jgi:hypothetical protein